MVKLYHWCDIFDMKHGPLLISACLCGVCCRYDGGCFDFPSLRQLVKEGHAIPFCPECAGGLSTPRMPCEIIMINNKRKVISRTGVDCTAEYVKGASLAVEICRKYNITTAILKDGSPSCGATRIYDGTHTGNCIVGQGVTAALLAENGVQLFTEQSLPILNI